MNERDVDRAVAAAIEGDASARRVLAARVAADPVGRVLFSGGGGVDRRLRLCETLAPVYRRTLAAMGIERADPGYLFDLLAPLTMALSDRAAARSRPLLVGLGGGPGAGKSTLSALLAACLPVAVPGAPRCLGVSLDDFYRSREERLRRGFRWRTLPGTHDTERLDTFLSDLDRAAAPFAVPRYDLGRDAPAADEVLALAPEICIFDGAMVGARLPGYEGLARRLDMLVYLDVAVPLLKEWRFARERNIRDRTGGAAGFAPAEMQAFWDEALGPSIEKWVRPNAKIADLVIAIGPGRRIEGARIRAVDAPLPEVLSHG